MNTHTSPQPESHVTPDPPECSDPDHWCYLTHREERRVKQQRLYLDYVARFERNDIRWGWVRFWVRSPVAALMTLRKGQPLPPAWRRQPLSEADYWADLLVKRIKSLVPKD